MLARRVAWFVDGLAVASMLPHYHQFVHLLLKYLRNFARVVCETVCCPCFNFSSVGILMST